MPGHVALLGDSTIDNEMYVDEGIPDVTANLQTILGEGWEVTRCARNGGTLLSLPWQLAFVPDDATHLIVSAGGNDILLNNADLLDLKQRHFRRDVSYFRQAMELLTERVEDFTFRYENALFEVMDLEIPVTVCTVYNCDFGILQNVVTPALTMFNEEIIRFAREWQLGLIDLRTVCFLPTDYVAEIEPSAAGGLKIARAFAASLIAAGQVAA